MAASRRDSIRRIATQLIALVQEDVLEDLRNQDPESALELYFAPLGLRPLPLASFSTSDCSVDGFYDPEFDPRRPWIFYCTDVAESRVRFTLLHELGHHLFASVGAHLLDDLDRIARSAGEAAQLEEAVCHEFAGNVLVPDATLGDVVGDGPLVPRHVVSIRELTSASWEAIAVRTANWMMGKVAVCIVRDEGRVSFVATNGLTPWRRGSAVKPGGPLARALSHGSTARPEVYRFGLGYAEALFCDCCRVDGRLAIAVLSNQASDGHFEILDQPEPAWKEREDFCQWCFEERNVGWCETCSGQRCHACHRCGCGAPRENPLCPECTQHNAFKQGSRVCVDCEADGLV